MKKSFVSVLLVCSLALTAVAAPSVAAADDIDQKIEQQDNKINELKGKQADAQAQIDALEEQVASINTKAEDLLAKQSKLFDASKALQKDIEDLQVRIEKREEAIQKQARDVQVNGQSTNFIDAVLDADSLTDAIGRVQAMTTIVNANNDLVQQQKEDQEAVKTKKAKNEQKLAEITENQATLEDQKGELISKQADLDVLKTTLAVDQATAESDKADLNKKKEEAEAEQARVQEEQRQVAEAQEVAEAPTAESNNTTESSSASGNSNNQETTPSTEVETPSTPNNDVEETPSTPNNDVEETPETSKPSVSTPPASNGGVVGYALSFVNKVPYTWGGNNPTEGFDCSGFTKYVFAASGISLPRTAGAQSTVGTVIPISQAQAGDLLFWGSVGSAGHVAIALGGGQYVHAPAPGQMVSVSSYQYYSPSFAVRM
ncbi:C40 family peptidase [Enterococcus massiliensis]|uniref:C40 family peptidase n=1 Tax=Enterococcus massiliensis TaxID=1640685 RepID=UPI00065E7734|nr:NlpC/P60 family protein [Enterococcus massiliensis]